MPATRLPAASNLERAKQYLKANENGAGFNTLAEFFSPDIVVECFPIGWLPMGTPQSFWIAHIRRTRPENHGEPVVRNPQCDCRRRFRCPRSLLDGFSRSCFREHSRRRTSACPLCHVPDLWDGKIISQRNYGCFEPF